MVTLYTASDFRGRKRLLPKVFVGVQVTSAVHPSAVEKTRRLPYVPMLAANFLEKEDSKTRLFSGIKFGHEARTSLLNRWRFHIDNLSVLIERNTPPEITQGNLNQLYTEHVIFFKFTDDLIRCANMLPIVNFFPKIKTEQLRGLDEDRSRTVL